MLVHHKKIYKNVYEINNMQNIFKDTENAHTTIFIFLIPIGNKVEV